MSRGIAVITPPELDTKLRKSPGNLLLIDARSEAERAESKGLWSAIPLNDALFQSVYWTHRALYDVVVYDQLGQLSDSLLAQLNEGTKRTMVLMGGLNLCVILIPQWVEDHGERVARCFSFDFLRYHFVSLSETRPCTSADSKQVDRS
jgi:hypothetical protein